MTEVINAEIMLGEKVGNFSVLKMITESKGARSRKIMIRL